MHGRIGETVMTLSRRLLSTVAALGLVATTAAAGLPAHTASAGPLPDVAVKYDGYNYGANGQVDIAFSVTSKDAPASGMLKTSCNYRFKSNDTHSRTETGQMPFSFPQPQAVPVPKVIPCAPSSTEFVSSVIMMADVVGGDSNTSNNTALFDSTTLPKPDVHVGYAYRQTNMQGWVKAGFGLTDVKADAPEVKLHAVCNYRYNQNKGYAGNDEQFETISLKKNQNAQLKEVYCAARQGQFVSSVFLSAEVQKPWVDANTSDNTAYWDRASMG
jgi:hypothetical protein